MIKHSALDHQFVRVIPETLVPGQLYVAMDYGMAVHSCACGCGAEVTTPLGPTDWSIIYDGETVTLHPSVGNWNLPCRSHYVIRRGKVIEAPPWTPEQVSAERARDAKAKADHYSIVSDPSSAASPAPAVSGWRRLLRLLISRI
ncbi:MULTISPECIES: DUF6527 family protein [Sphingobium]|uniref:DUF6527 family protein n=1 Tax=Sphingobium TaxID=165695 RepID=UPI0015EC65A1|nr:MULTISPECIES: DUF6527 family protein [Sphingobium]MCW2363158.1 hypothetical protein [Sphingobium sp. B10D3B]MCW2400162.1 hypothetical protein [Sphingobium sp. B10D7B]MCW2407140.1 hypothetical protein [Sphingobium xanthum]